MNFADVLAFLKSNATPAEIDELKKLSGPQPTTKPRVQSIGAWVGVMESASRVDAFAKLACDLPVSTPRVGLAFKLPDGWMVRLYRFNGSLICATAHVQYPPSCRSHWHLTSVPQKMGDVLADVTSPSWASAVADTCDMAMPPDWRLTLPLSERMSIIEKSDESRAEKEQGE